MNTGRLCVSATMAFLLLSLSHGPAAAGSSARDGARDRLAALADKASTDRQILTQLYRMQDEYVARATREGRGEAGRKKLQETTDLLQRNTDQINSSLRMATEAAETLSTRLRRSGVLERMAQLEAGVQEAGARLSTRWEFEQATRARERDQREREAGERARAQRR